MKTETKIAESTVGYLVDLFEHYDKDFSFLGKCFLSTVIEMQDYIRNEKITFEAVISGLKNAVHGKFGIFCFTYSFTAPNEKIDPNSFISLLVLQTISNIYAYHASPVLTDPQKTVKSVYKKRKQIEKTIATVWEKRMGKAFYDSAHTVVDAFLNNDFFTKYVNTAKAL